MLIIVAHGSHDSSWRASVERVAESLQADLGPDKLQLAYMDCTPPTLDDVVSDAVEAGVRQIRVLPLFLADEGHVNRDIRPAVEAVRAAHPSVEVNLLPAVGQNRSFREMLAKIAIEPEPET
jgi:sirohydrochlorin cobaltochelatase